jgi:nitroreductase
MIEIRAMRKNIINMAAIGFYTLALTACGNAASNQPEAKADKAATEIPADSIIKLLEPDKTLDASLMQALTDRASQREFADKQLSLEDLSSLLWAANGVNREDGKRTAPSAVNAQDVDIYVSMASGAYLYDAKQSQLTRITTEDLSSAVCGKQPMEAPVFLVMVADISRYPEGLASQRPLVESFAAMDAGYVSQNICLYCSAAKLATVPRASMDKEALTKSLNLKDTQIPLLNNPVGYMK